MKKLFLFAISLIVGLIFVTPVKANNGSLPGCNKPGTTFVGTVENPGEPGVYDWKLVMHGSYTLGKCDGTGPNEGDWNVQMIRSPEGYWEFYKNVFTSQNLTDMGAFLYSDKDYASYHPTYADDGTIWWWIIKANGDSPFMEPSVGGVFEPVNAQPGGFGFYR